VRAVTAIIRGRPVERPRSSWGTQLMCTRNLLLPPKYWCESTRDRVSPAAVATL